MANYKRVISYMYAYRNQLKGSNVGFARIETRGNECKITLHVRTVNMKDQEVGAYIYCWYGQELHAVYLGDIHISNGVGEIVIKTDVDNIMKTKYRFSDMGGILLYISDAQYIATEWDGKAIVFNSLKIDTVKPDTFGSATPREKEPTVLKAAAKENAAIPEKKPVTSIPSMVEKESVAKVESAVAVVVPEEKKQPVVQAIGGEQTLDDMIEQEVAKEEQQEEEQQEKEQQEEEQQEKEQQEQEQQEQEQQQQEQQRKEQEPPAPLLRRNPFVAAMKKANVEPEKKSESKTKTETETETETKIEEKVDIKEDITIEKKEQRKDKVEVKQMESATEQDMAVDVAEVPEQEPLSKAFPLSQEKMERLDQQAQELFGTMLLNTLFPPEGKEAEETAETSKKEETVQETSTEQQNHPQDQESEEAPHTLSINPRNAIECFTAFRSCESAKEYDEIQEEISTMKAQVAHLQHISEEWKIKEARLQEIEREREEAKRGAQAEEEKHKIEEQIRSEFHIGGIEGQLAAAEVKRVMEEKVFAKYPKIMPFEQGEAEECVRIAPQDLGIFPMENWILANNSFLLHGYYTYRHLIFLMEKDGGAYHYLLGVPGVNHSREQFMANMFGFTIFKKLSQAAHDSGEFGYWCQEIIL